MFRITPQTMNHPEYDQKDTTNSVQFVIYSGAVPIIRCYGEHAEHMAKKVISVLEEELTLTMAAIQVKDFFKDIPFGPVPRIGDIH
jgi:hypothetical protein